MFLHRYFCLPTLFLYTQASRSDDGANIGLWAALWWIVRSSQKWFNWKKMSERTVKYSRHDVFSPLFLPPRSVFINASGRQGRQGEHRSLGCDNIDRAFAPKMVKLKKVSQRTDKYSRHGVFIPFFLPPSSVFINSSRQQ